MNKQEELQNYIKDYINEYEYRGEGGDYSPSTAEKTLIEDVIQGLIVEDKFAELIANTRRKSPIIDPKIIEAASKNIGPAIDKFTKKMAEEVGEQVRIQMVECNEEEITVEADDDEVRQIYNIIEFGPGEEERLPLEHWINVRVPWLEEDGRSETLDDAIAIVRRYRQKTVDNENEIKRLKKWLEYIEGNFSDYREAARNALNGNPQPFKD